MVNQFSNQKIFSSIHQTGKIYRFWKYPCWLEWDQHEHWWTLVEVETGNDQTPSKAERVHPPYPYNPSPGYSHCMVGVHKETCTCVFTAERFAQKTIWIDLNNFYRRINQYIQVEPHILMQLQYQQTRKTKPTQKNLIERIFLPDISNTI